VWFNWTTGFDVLEGGFGVAEVTGNKNRLPDLPGLEIRVFCD